MLASLNVVLGCVLLYVSPREERRRLPWVAGVLVMAFIAMVLFVGDPYLSVIRQRVVNFGGKTLEYTHTTRI